MLFPLLFASSCSPLRLRLLQLALVGILVFAILPGLEVDGVTRGALLGGLLGLVAYSTFDLTAMAVFRDFPLRVALMDIAWGSFVTAFATSAGVLIGRSLGMGG